MISMKTVSAFLTHLCSLALCLEGRTMSKSTCAESKGRSSVSQLLHCQSHAESMVPVHFFSATRGGGGGFLPCCLQGLLLPARQSLEPYSLQTCRQILKSFRAERVLFLQEDHFQHGDVDDNSEMIPVGVLNRFMAGSSLQTLLQAARFFH